MKHYVTMVRGQAMEFCSHPEPVEKAACPFNRNEVQRAHVDEGEHVCDFCGKRYSAASESITRKDAADIAKSTGGDPEVWDRLFGVTA